MNRNKLAWFLIAIVILSLSTGCSSRSGKVKDVVVGFIYVSPIGEGGWTYSHDQGRLALEKAGIKTLYKESIPETWDVETAVLSMIDEGANVIVSTSFGYAPYIEEIAVKHRDVKFLQCSGLKSTDNLTGYFGRIEEPRFLSGLVAGLKTQTNKIGYVAAMNFPEVVRGINAFALGVQTTNPKATVEVEWTHSWFDPVLEKEAAMSLIDKHCDVIAQHQDTGEPQKAAQERGVWSIGYHTDMKAMAPRAYMTAPIWNWAPYYLKQVEDLKANTWDSAVYMGGLKDNMVDLAPLTENAPSGAKTVIENYKNKIIDGKFKLFQGPIYDTNNVLKIQEGATLSEEALQSMNWFVKGVIVESDTQ